MKSVTTALVLVAIAGCGPAESPPPPPACCPCAPEAAYVADLSAITADHDTPLEEFAKVGKEWQRARARLLECLDGLP